ncbi:hypothetical protein MAR_030943, partial [Mya arenaria]
THVTPIHASKDDVFPLMTTIPAVVIPALRAEIVQSVRKVLGTTIQIIFTLLDHVPPIHVSMNNVFLLMTTVPAVVIPAFGEEIVPSTHVPPIHVSMDNVFPLKTTTPAVVIPAIGEAIALS